MGDKVTRAVHQKILDLLRGGSTHQEVANALGIGHNTVWRYSKKPLPMDFEDLGASVQAQLLAAAKQLKKGSAAASVEQLADHLGVPPKVIREAAAALKSQGSNIDLGAGTVDILQDVRPAPPTRIDVTKFKGQHFKFGVTADNHLGSRYERMDVLNALFDIWHAQDVPTVLQLGNMIDGEARFNKHDLHKIGMREQCKYFAEAWPSRPGMETHFITGDDHEGWYVQREGVDIGRVLQMYCEDAGRSDVKYLGHMEHNLVLQAPGGYSTLRMIHAGGGTAYALSYQPQSIINSLQGGEKPNILLIGHYHKAEFNYWREVLCLQAGCTEDQTPFMRKKNIQAHVGGWTIEFDIDDYGVVHAFKQEWHPFYDRGFYEGGLWKYQWDGTLRRSGPGKRSLVAPKKGKQK